MCGRFTLAKNLDEIAAYFKAKKSGNSEDGSPLWDWEPNYNIAPGSVIAAMAYDGRRQRKIVPMRWGLHPHWKKTPPEGRPMFNARGETAAEKASFRTPFRRRRALIPATGWYEWEGVEKPKTPYLIHEKSREVFAFAGLWDQWRVDEGITLLSCTILTTAATGPIKHLHHRMPVRLPSSKWNDWLDWDEKPDHVLRDMKSSHDLDFYEVATQVNSGRAVGADLIRRV